METIQQLGIAFIEQLQTLSPTLDPVMEFFSFLGTFYFIMFFVPLIYWLVDRRTGLNLLFLLLSAACYIRSSKRFYNWLISNRLFGNYIRNYIEQKGVSLRVKVLTLALLWTTIGCSAALGTDTLWLRIVLVLIAIGVTAHILSLRTLTR